MNDLNTQSGKNFKPPTMLMSCFICHREESADLKNQLLRLTLAGDGTGAEGGGEGGNEGNARHPRDTMHSSCHNKPRHHNYRLSQDSDNHYSFIQPTVSTLNVPHFGFAQICNFKFVN